MRAEKENLDLGQKLMLLQGVNLIQDGMQFFNWIDMPSETAFDALNILRDRFQLFQETVTMDAQYDHLVIDRMRDQAENIKYGNELNRKIKAELEELRKLVVIKQHESRAEKEREKENE